jgi:pimeloyl-ACP methyl ester carboxylesterase
VPPITAIFHHHFTFQKSLRDRFLCDGCLMLLLSLTLLLTPVDSVAVRDIQVARGETLRTTSVGTGQPIVLIPGLFGGAYSFRKITGPLVDQGYRTIVVEPLGYGWSSHPKNADYSLDAQTRRVARTLEQMGIKHALLVAHAAGAGIGFRLAIQRPDLVRGLLSIDGPPAQSAATPELKKAFTLGVFAVKLLLDPPRARHELRDELVSNSADPRWVTDAVVRGYTAGQIADLDGSIDALHQMTKAKESDSLADRLNQCRVPVMLLVGAAPHRREVSGDDRELLRQRLPRFSMETVPSAGQYIQEEQPGAVLAAIGRLDLAAKSLVSR